MKAIVWSKYGTPEVLQIQEVEKPLPKENEVRVKIHATTVTAGDCEMRSLKFPFWLSIPLRIWIGFIKPRGTTIPGTELAGEVESVGKGVTLFNQGDQVFGSSGMSFGTNAEYICLPEQPAEMGGVLTIKPENMTYDQAVAVPFGGLDSLHFLRKANIKDGQKVLVNGAGGSIGTFAIQLAKHFGAEVTAVDSEEKLEMLLSIGADHVVDYNQEDFTKNGKRYDVIFDVVGKSSFSRSIKSLKPHGYYLLANPRLFHMVRSIWTNLRSSKKVVFQVASKKLDDLLFLKGLIENGELVTIIDRRYPLEEVAEAHRYVETGRKQGNVVITVGGGDSP